MKMGLLRSVDNVPGIHYYEYRDMDYFNKFKYRARVVLPGVRFTYWVKTIDEWRDKVRNGKTWSRTYTPQEKVEMLNMSPTMEKFIDLKNNLKKNKNASIRIEGETAAIFSNDLQFLQDIKTWANNVDFTEAVCAEYKGTKYFVGDPPHKYRVYLKSKRIENSIYNDLGSLLSNNKSLNPSRALEKWLFGLDNISRWKSFYLSSAYFIDYDDESTLSYLAIMHGDLLGRKYKLEKRPDTE
jgi:hypothetical protein